MGKITIGYIFYGASLGSDEKAFLKIAKKKRINLVLIDASRDVNEEELKEKIRRCDLVFNNSAEVLSMEIVKTIEELGKKVVESSGSFYYEEDKWMFFLKCQKYKIPTINTILLSENINLAKKELEKFGQWPVVLKRVEGTCGEYVDKADNLREAEKIIHKFWKKGVERLPIIAQEFIKSNLCYRVTVINNKIVQNAIKQSKGWKATGVHAKKIKRFSSDAQLEKIVKKISRAFRISIYGIDLFKIDGKWMVIEINAEPAFDFFESRREEVIGLVLDFLIRKAKARK